MLTSRQHNPMTQDIANEAGPNIRFPAAVPSQPVIWAENRHQGNQIQQTKGSAKPQITSVIPTTQPAQSAVPPRTTPSPVSSVRIVRRNSGTNRVVTVQFNHPTDNPYFSGANVYLKKANGQPTLVASGSKSPLAFTVASNSAPHSVFVSSVGNWGETDINSSPSAPVRLG